MATPTVYRPVGLVAIDGCLLPYGLRSPEQVLSERHGQTWSQVSSEVIRPEVVRYCSGVRPRSVAEVPETDVAGIHHLRPVGVVGDALVRSLERGRCDARLWERGPTDDVCDGDLTPFATRHKL